MCSTDGKNKRVKFFQLLNFSNYERKTLKTNFGLNHGLFWRKEISDIYFYFSQCEHMSEDIFIILLIIGSFIWPQIAHKIF